MKNKLYKHCTGYDSKRHLIFQWPWWFGKFRGFTLGPIIFVKDKNDLPVIVHELVHVDQFYRQPITFWFRYLIELKRHGYRGNKYEIEAYVVQRKAIMKIKLGGI